MLSTVIVASPDNKYRYHIADLFDRGGYKVIQGADSLEVVTLVRNHNPEIILLSEDMPSLDGREIVPTLRRSTMAPMIVLGRGDSSALIKSVLNGADAYVNRPVNCDELLVRARNLLRRANTDVHFAAGDLGSDVVESLIALIETPLTETETKLFKCLASQLGTLVRTADLMKRVWGGQVKGERLRFYVHSLRRKLVNSASLRLHTQKGVGYRLIESKSIGKRETID